MTKSDVLINIIETDILVIGGGASGLWAANRAKELGSDVLVVDKGPSDWGGSRQAYSRLKIWIART